MITSHQLPCASEDIALKSFFLGPMAENEEWLRTTFDSVVREWCDWRRAQYPDDGAAISKKDQSDPSFISSQIQFKSGVRELVNRFQSEIPKFSPRYMGHMFSEVSLPALLGHFVALLQNPNNISSESSRVGIGIEREAITALARMVGFTRSESRGHFTSGGSVANFEAVFRALERASAKGLARDQGIFLLPHHSHYSWKKSLKIFGVPEKCVAWLELDENGRVDLVAFKTHLKKLRDDGKHPVLCLGVVGSTEIGAMDPIGEMKSGLDQYFPNEKCWFHADAAYGGFYGTLKEPSLSVRQMNQADSVTLDPHKLGYVPYSAGVFICRKREDYYSVSTDAPYVQFEKNLDPGPFTLEGSRSATGAAAVWMMEKTIGLDSNGLGKIIQRTMDARAAMQAAIETLDQGVFALDTRDSNIICITCARVGERVTESNRRTLSVLQRLSDSDRPRFTVSKTVLDHARYSRLLERSIQKWDGQWDEDSKREGLVVLRLCLMNPFTDSKEMNTDFIHEFVKLIQ